MSSFWLNKYTSETTRNWDLFYKRNENRFFKDRHWVAREFPELEGDGALLEVGCGVGNLVLPLRDERPNLTHIYASDFSSRAVEILKVCQRCREIE